MTEDRVSNFLEEFENALSQTELKFVLRLYITGATSRSAKAVENIKHLCEKYLQGRYELEVIDIYQHPELTENEQIIAAPTLIKQLPPPLRKLIGDMSDEERILIALGLKEKERAQDEGVKRRPRAREAADKK